MCLIPSFILVALCTLVCIRCSVGRNDKKYAEYNNCPYKRGINRKYYFPRPLITAQIRAVTINPPINIPEIKAIHVGGIFLLYLFVGQTTLIF